MKRKAINDFFLPAKKKSTALASLDSREVTDGTNAPRLEAQETAVPGLSLYRDFVTPTEEAGILGFLNDSSKCAWRTDLSRRTMHFGGTYCVMPPKNDAPKQAKPQVLQAPDMPQKFQWLIQRFVDTNVCKKDQKPQFCIVNEYTGNLGISAHTENFQFGEPVVGLSLLSACPIRFHELTEAFNGSVRSGQAPRANKTGRMVDIQLPARSLLVMNGPSRWSWQHEIARSAKGRGPGWKRVSLTFRFKP
ncbi:MAG: hypothetical protein Q9208_006044 [Pyrenodesmia sp. 3 TL-2023]